MPVVSKLQSGFTSGELDPKLRARTDVAAYYTGAAKLRNVLVIPQGAAKRRPGLEYVSELPTGSIQMIPFIFSAAEHYIIIVTANLVKIYEHGQLMDTVVITMSDTQVKECTWAQSYDTLLLFHKDLAPISIIRASSSSWSASNWTLTNIPTSNIRTATTTTLTIKDSASADIDFSAWVTGDVATGAKCTAGAAYFAASDVGSSIRAGGGYAKITAYVSTTEVTVTVLAPFRNDTTDGDTVYLAGEWAVEAPVWSATAGYPRCGTFFQGRLYMASTARFPSTIWGSEVNNENSFRNWIPDYDDNGVEVTAGGGLQTEFHHLHSGQHLTALSDTGEYYIPTTEQQPITPTNISLKRNGAMGSEALVPVTIDGAVVFIRTGGRSLIESQYNFADGGYTNKDLSLLSSHLLDSPVAISYRKQANTDEADYVNVINSDGTLSVLCTLRIQEVTAWTKCTTDGRFVGTCVDQDITYFAVDRVIGGIPKRCLERFNSDCLLDSSVIDPTILLTYSDTQLTYSGKNMSYFNSSRTFLTSDNKQLTYDGVDISYNRGGYTTAFNLGHLNNQSCKIILDNTIQADQTVGSGSVTLDHLGYGVEVGLDFPIVDRASGSQVYIETMPVEVELADGSSVGKKKRVIEATVMLYETSHIEIQRNKATIRRIGIDTLDTDLPKRTENLTIQGLLGWDDEINISVGQTLPLPMQLLGLAYKVRV